MVMMTLRWRHWVTWDQCDEGMYSKAVYSFITMKATMIKMMHGKSENTGGLTEYAKMKNG